MYLTGGGFMPEDAGGMEGECPRDPLAFIGLVAISNVFIDMPCKGILCRNKGSGYVKEDPVNAEGTKKLNDRLAERAKQDALLFSPLPTTGPSALPSALPVLPAIRK